MIGLNGSVTPGIIIPLVVLAVALVAVWTWYSRAIRNPPAAPDRAEASGVRLTSESLRRLGSPWRVVHEIGDRLPDVDHVAIGPPGVVAVHTVIGERPDADEVARRPNLAAAVTNAAIVRARVDEMLTVAGTSCSVLASVYWGMPDARRPAGETAVQANPYVEGQRLVEWLTALPADPAMADPARIDLAFRAVAMGIGRPDPLG